MHAIYGVTIIHGRHNSILSLKGAGKVILILLALVGFFFFDVVYIVAVMNYAAQSEMNVHLLRATRICIEEKIDYTSEDSTLPDSDPQEPIKSKIDTAIKVCIAIYISKN